MGGLWAVAVWAAHLGLSIGMRFAFNKQCSPSTQRPSANRERSRSCQSGRDPNVKEETTGNIRILAVDDDAHQLKAIKRCLRRSHFEVATAKNGKAGLRMARERPPDLVLLDVSMPTMSGHEFLRRFRRLVGDDGTKFTEIPVIFLTALDTPDQKVAGLDADAVDYITKPCDSNELRARIRNQVRRRHKQLQTLASAKDAASRLEAAVDAMAREARACGDPLHELQDSLESAERVSPPAAQHDLLSRASKNAGRLTRRLLRIVEWGSRREKETK